MMSHRKKIVDVLNKLDGETHHEVSRKTQRSVLYLVRKYAHMLYSVNDVRVLADEQAQLTAIK